MNAVTKTTSTGFSLAPSNMGEAMKFAEMLAGSTMVPRDFQGKPANVLIAVQWGYEVGLGPMQAIQNIAVINGRPAIWGDAALALVRAHPACERITEGVEGDGEARHGFCEVVRRGEPPQRRTFSVADAKKAGLWGKAGPWQQYPERMLQLRARGFAIRDVFPDALRGVITAEEAQDTPPMREATVIPERTIPDGLPAPREPAPPGSMRAEAEAMALPLLTHENKLIRKSSPAKWLDAVHTVLGNLHDAEAVAEWRAAMGATLAEISERQADMVAEAEGMIRDRIASFSEQPA